MDASGFEMGTDGLQENDSETTAFSAQSFFATSADETFNDGGWIDDGAIDPDMPQAMFYSMVDQDVGENAIPMDVGMIRHTWLDETDFSDGSGVVDDSIFQTLGAPLENNDGVFETNSLNGITFDFDIDQSGSLSRLDVEMLINYLNDFFKSENPQSNLNEMSLMDVDGDLQLTPLDALIVINELNRSWALEDFAANESSRLADSSSWIAGDLLDAATDASVDDSIDGSSEMSVARMTDLAMSDFAYSTEASKIAYFKSLSSTKKDGMPFFISVDENGKVSAIADSQALEVSVDEDHLISVDNESTGLAVVDLDGDFLLSQYADADSLMFS